MRGVLQDCGFRIVGGTDLYHLVEHGDASAICDKLKRNHILVREFENSPSLLRFGLCADEAALGRLGSALERMQHD